MTAPGITLAALSKLDPCTESLRRVRALLRKLNSDKDHCFTAAEARAAGCTYEDVIWAAAGLAMNDEAVARRLTGYINDCAIKVLPFWEAAHPDDDRPRKAILATTGFLNGKVSEEDWGRAAWDAWDARFAWAAWDARFAWSARVIWGTQNVFPRWQFDRLVYWLGENPKPMPAKPKGGKS